jgi:hypothetical protein
MRTFSVACLAPPEPENPIVGGLLPGFFICTRRLNSSNLVTTGSVGGLSEEVAADPSLTRWQSSSVSPYEIMR